MPAAPSKSSSRFGSNLAAETLSPTSKSRSVSLGAKDSSGVMSSLGTLNGDLCSIAWAINAKGQVVGSSSADCDFSGTSTTEHAFLWKDGEIIDLNDFVPSGSHLTLVEPHYINNRGEITGNAVLPDGSLRAFLLIPCNGLKATMMAAWMLQV